jgi:hypothetical protein
MSTPIAVVSADTHLAQRAWTKHPGLAGDSYYGLEQLVDYCTAHELDLILAGDVFDKTRPDPTTIFNMRRSLDRMERQSLDVHYIQGQHELDRENPWINAVSWWPSHQHRKAFTIKEVRFYGLDWTPADKVQEEFGQVPEGTDVFVGHQVWLDLMGPRIGESECKFADVPHVKMIVTGDFHRHQRLYMLNSNPIGRFILSPGPVCMQSIDEDPAKKFFVLNDDLKVSSIDLRVRACYRFAITNQDELEIFLTGNVPQAVEPQQGVPDHIAKNVIHVTYQDDIPEAYARITNAVGNRAHLFMVPVKQKQEIITVETAKRRALADGGMEACIELIVKKDECLYNDAQRLLGSTNPAETLDTMRALFLQNFGSNGNDRGQIHRAVDDGVAG